MKGFWQGAFAGIVMFLLYFGLLAIANSFDHAVTQTIANLPFIVLLVVGFGVQVALFFHVREFSKTAATAEMAGSGGMSLASMAACCAHHLVDFGALLGLTAVLTFLAKYQTAFFILAIASNLYGISTMLNLVKRNGLYEETGLFTSIISMWRPQYKQVLIAFIVLFVPLSFLLPAINVTNAVSSPVSTQQIINLRGIEIEATPLIQGQVISFAIKLTTHSGSLDVDLEKDAFITDSNGNKYFGKWAGSPLGGHHRSGTLTFESVSGALSTLEINNINNGTALFNWS